MGHFFRDPLHERFAVSRTLALASHGAAEWGEVAATCARIADGDDDSWYEQWCATADRLDREAECSAHGGHRISARDAYLRVSAYYAAAYRPLYGGPRADERLLEAFRRQRRAFERAAELMEPPGEPMGIELDGAVMPAYLLLADGSRRPLLIATSGYDSTLEELYLAHARPALRRGYHCLIFDGPGQGAMLFEQGALFRPDWESVVARVVDAVEGREEVDRDRIALMGWSFGGHLAPRAAGGEHRLAACVADPGLYGIAEGMIQRMRASGVPEKTLERYPDIEQAELDPMAEAVHADRFLRWTVERRNFWVHGATDLAGLVRATAPFTLEGRIGSIRCPTLVALAEGDPLASSAEQVYQELSRPKELVRFTAAEGADMHCEAHNRSLFDQRAFDWLDRTLGR